jgi:hypothetical protein
MKDYIKPTFALAGLVPVAFAASDCGITKGEIADIFQNDFGWEYSDQALAMTESCQVKYDIEMFCKFTSTDVPEFKVLGS